MVVKETASRKLFHVINYTILFIICIICILPLWHVFMASFSDPALVNSYNGFILRPLGKINFNGYKIILLYRNLWEGYANTLFYIVMQCIITGMLTLIAAYILTRKRMRYRNAIMAFMMFTMMFSGGMIPTYMVVRNLNLLDSRLALLIPSAISVFNIIIMRTGIDTIPDSLEESARVDGANALTIVFKIILPLCKATFAVIILFTAIAKWNEWYPALLYLPNATQKYPLQMVLRSILISNTSEATSNANDIMNNTQLYKTLVKYCVIVVSTGPILCFYPFVQKYFVCGVMIGSVKG